jgi:hypothetical protein
VALFFVVNQGLNGLWGVGTAAANLFDQRAEHLNNTLRFFICEAEVEER